MWVAQDAKYNVVAIFDNSGTVVERYAYDPFGSVTVLNADWNVRAASAFGWLHLHQGGRYDTISGLYHFRHRDYSPTLGRWTRLDPLRYEAGDVNPYRVVFNAPTGYTDPSGLSGVGHHWVPVSLLKDPNIRKLLTDDAINVALGAVSGYIGEHNFGSTYYGVKHREYNELVKEQLIQYIQANGINENNKMRGDQMQQFAERMRDGLRHDGKNTDELLNTTRSASLTREL